MVSFSMCHNLRALRATGTRVLFSMEIFLKPHYATVVLIFSVRVSIVKMTAEDHYAIGQMHKQSTKRKVLNARGKAV